MGLSLLKGTSALNLNMGEWCSIRHKSQPTLVCMSPLPVWGLKGLKAICVPENFYDVTDVFFLYFCSCTMIFHGLITPKLVWKLRLSWLKKYKVKPAETQTKAAWDLQLSMDKNLQLLFDIDQELDSEEVASLKFLCSDVLGRKHLATVSDARDLFTRLTEQGYLEDDMLFLQELLLTIRRFDLLKHMGLTKQQVLESLQIRGKTLSTYRSVLMYMWMCS